jgi:serine/threonine protein kinase
MGVVYRARDVTLDREAFRFIAPEKRRDSEARRRFLREAQAASQLDDQALSAGARDIVTECEVILRLLGIEPRSPGEG